MKKGTLWHCSIVSAMMILASLLMACNSDDEQSGPEVCNPPLGDDAGVLPFADPNGSSMYDFPFPSDHLLTDEGYMNLDGFPNPMPSSLIRDFVAYGNSHYKGWGTDSALYVRFSDALDPDALPSPWDSREDSSPVLLINIDPASPEYGQRTPLQVGVNLEAGDDYFPPNTLATAPHPGFPLMPATTYALVVTTGLKAADGSNVGAPDIMKRLVMGVDSDNGDLADLLDIYQPLRDFMAAGKAPFTACDVAAATVFTTMDPMEDLRKIRTYINEKMTLPQIINVERNEEQEYHDYYAFDGIYTSPNFQKGDVPYNEDNTGGFRWDANGNPIVQRIERLRFRVVVPSDMEMPAEGWPIVMYAHGTYGDFETFARNSKMMPANILTKKGLAVIGIDQPMHGARKEGKNFDEGFVSFNFTNPEAGAHAFRQSAIDTLVLTRAFKESFLSIPADVSPTGAEIRFDPAKVLFLGHSHGGISGSLVMGLEDQISAAVLSGAGGLLAKTILLRKDYFNFEELIKLMLGIDEEKTLTLLHPAIALIQSMVEVTDPINYAPFYVTHNPTGHGNHMVYTTGFWDEATPHETNEALMTAARFPIMEPAGWSIEGMDLRGMEIQSAPASNNCTGPDGQPVTCGVHQYNSDEASHTHYVIFRDENAAEMYGNFLYTAAYEGTPVIN